MSWISKQANGFRKSRFDRRASTHRGDKRRLQVIDLLLQDVRFALRGLRRSPGFAFAAVATLGLGIGANTAIFSVVYAALLKPLPYANPEELVAVSVSVPQLQSQFPSLPVRPVDFKEFSRSNSVFSGMAAIREHDVNLTGRGEPERLYGARVSANLFPLLGVEPQLGRTFLPEEDSPGLDTSVLISHDLWVRRFGGDPDIVGRTLPLDGRPHVVVGVMPDGFPFPTGKQLHTHIELGPRIDVWKPMAFTQAELNPDDMGRFSWGVIGRLKPGTSRQAAQTNLDAIARNIGEEMQGRIPGLAEFDLRTRLLPIRDVFSGDVRQGLLLLMGAVGLLLAIACVNLVNLLLARLSSRSREIATRTALGASRVRLVRQLITESVVLAALGGVVGLPIAVWGTQLLLSLGPVPLAAAQSIQLNLPLFLFAVATVLVVGLVVGLVPAFEVGRAPLHGHLREGGRGATTGRRAGHVQRTLIAAEVALCTTLLVVAGLLVRSFVNVLDAESGFAAHQALSVDLALSDDRYGGSQRVAFYRELLESVRSLPGVVSAGAVSILPLTSGAEGTATRVFLEGDTEDRLDRPSVHYRVAAGEYFAAMGIPVLAGRLFEENEPAQVVLVSEDLGRGLWPGVSPSEMIGRRIRIGEVTDDAVSVLGVVGDVRAAGLDRDPMPSIYVPHMRNRVGAMTIVIRTAQEPGTLASAIRSEVAKRDEAIPAPTVRTLDDIVSASVAPRRFQTAMIGLLATLALGLALVGVYGVTSYGVARQTREIGVRVALGAKPSIVLRSVLAQGLRPVAVGLLIGLPAAIAAAAAIRRFLFGLGPLDPVAFGAMAMALLLTATIACYVPARRAARVDPVIALRAE